MTSEHLLELFSSVRVAYLATIDAQIRPHLVPIVFTVQSTSDQHVIYTAVDSKPKRTANLRRIANVRANSHVCVLADHYSDDWNSLWWVRADGSARVLDATGDPEAISALEALARRYPQYQRQPPLGPVMAIDVHHLIGWQATP